MVNWTKNTNSAILKFHSEPSQKIIYSFENNKLLISLLLDEKKDLTPKKIKETVAKGVKLLDSLKVNNIDIELNDTLADNYLEVITGAELGVYRYKGYHQVDKTTTINLSLVSDNLNQLKLDTAKTVVQGMVLTRNWANTPGNLLTPKIFAEEIKSTLTDVDCTVEIFAKDKIAALKMNLISAIGNSSANSPKFVVAKYVGNPSCNKTIGLVGKGITVDTGGYNLKTADGLKYTKDDMSGAATVAGALYSIAKNKLKVNVTAIMPLCENRLSNSSLIPGDVITSMNGKTVEILNTDAEGRLILADALTYAVRIEKVTEIIDLATLTGAIVRTFGSVYTGGFTNNNKLFKEINDSARAVGEKIWRLPIDDEYRAMIKSKVADIQNIGAVNAGSITAAAFLEEFVENTPWVHLDIAGTNFSTSKISEYELFGATGALVPTLYKYAESKSQA